MMSLVLALALQPAFSAETRRFAVVSSSNDGGPGRVELRFSDHDASEISEVFQSVGGIQADHTWMVSDASPDTIDQALDEVSAAVAQAHEEGLRTELFFYYSGHSDEVGLLPNGISYDYQALKDELKAVASDVQLVILDSCSSGAMVRQKGGTMRSPFLVDESIDITGHAYLTSSSADEAAQESDRIGGSYFTHYLVSGLRGAADASQNGQITLSEVYQFAYDETLARTERSKAGPQHPSYDLQLAGTGDLVVTDLREASSGLVLSKGFEGRLFVRDGAGRLVAELYKPGTRQIDLVLDPGDYSVFLLEGENMREARFTLDDASQVLLSDLLFDNVKGLAGTVKGSAPAKQLKDSAVWIGIMPNAGWKDIRQHVALSLGAAAAGEVRGVQATIAGNVSNGDVKGVQATVGANIALGDVKGGQFAVGYNHAPKTLEGVQSATGISVANELDGAQISIVNLGKKVKGAQIGLLNVGGRVDGLQLGLLNVANDAEESIGLLSINRTGYNTLQAFGGTDNPVNLAGTFGGKHIYTLATWGALPRQDASTRHEFTLGMGGHIDLGRGFVDIDGATGNNSDEWATEDTSILVRVRLIGGVELMDHLALFAGPTWTIIPDLGHLQHPVAYQTVRSYGSGGKVKRPGDDWFGFVAGVRF